MTGHSGTFRALLVALFAALAPAAIATSATRSASMAGSSVTTSYAYDSASEQRADPVHAAQAMESERSSAAGR
jgi:hypothetical protein